VAALATALIALAVGGAARAQQGAGALTGRVTNNVTKEPLAGVVVTVTSPALPDSQLVTTDESGYYRLPNLPPGVYYVQFDKEGYLPNGSADIAIRSDTTLRLNAAMASGAEEVIIVQRPNVDVGSSTTGTTISADVIRRVPVSAPGGKGSAARSFESVATVAPGANADSYGTAINGASSPENHYAVDGLSVGNPGKGTLGTQLSSEFVSEVNVVTAGYMPEFGRTTGGILNVVTKSGSNEFHGSVFSFYSPGGLEGERRVPLLDATPVAYAPKLDYVGDVGFDLGGPIIKNKLWFYTGFDISSTHYTIARSIHRTVKNAMGKDEIEEVPIYSQDFAASARTVQGLAKLTWALNTDNRLSLAVFGSPTRSGGGAKFDGTTVTPGDYGLDPLSGTPEVGGNGTYSATAHQYSSTPIDASLRWNSQFLSKRLMVDLMLGTHYQADSVRASDGSSSLSNSRTALGYYYNVNWRRAAKTPMGYHSIQEFERFPTAARCDQDGANCKVSEYASGAPRDLNEALYNRYHGSLIVSYLANLAGHHLAKAGVDGELTSYRNQKSNRVFTESEDGTQFNDEERFGMLLAPDQFLYIDPLTKKSSAMTVGGFVQDSWSVMDKVTVNLGLRYDAQYFYNTSGAVALSLPNQWSPRLGVIYDFTQNGRSKVFFNYARYFENAPLDFADVALVGEPQLHGGHVCDPTIYSQQRNECQAPGALRPNTQDDPRLPNRIFTAGGSTNAIDPSIEASSSDEVSLGAEYELLSDARVGVTITKRWINRWIEDMNPVAGLPGFDGNPGFGLGSSFPKAARDYNALTLFLMKSFSDSWLAQASYTLATLRGNYSGLFAPEDNYLGPNATADFDSPNVENNRYGDLPGDYRQTLKVLGAKDWAVRPDQHFGAGVSLRARSGGATSYLGADPHTYPMESYLVQRGAGKRLPWQFGADIQLAYRMATSKSITLSGTLDIFNIFNFQAVTSTNEEYTTSNVVATQGYKVADLDKLTNDEGDPVDMNPAFGQAKSYQEPRVVRLGLRGEF
jgi:hypothetical protein